MFAYRTKIAGKSASARGPQLDRKRRSRSTLVQLAVLIALAGCVAAPPDEVAERTEAIVTNPSVGGPAPGRPLRTYACTSVTGREFCQGSEPAVLTATAAATYLTAAARNWGCTTASTNPVQRVTDESRGRFPNYAKWFGKTSATGTNCGVAYWNGEKQAAYFLPTSTTMVSGGSNGTSHLLYAKWAALGRETGVLGMPISNPVAYGWNNTTYQLFKYGVITLRSKDTAAHYATSRSPGKVVNAERKALVTRYLDTFGVSPTAGPPLYGLTQDVTDACGVPGQTACTSVDDVGEVLKFWDAYWGLPGYVIARTGQTSAFVVHAPQATVWDAYRNPPLYDGGTPWSASTQGFPTSQSSSIGTAINGQTVEVQSFEGGVITWRPANCDAAETCPGGAHCTTYGTRSTHYQAVAQATYSAGNCVACPAGMTHAYGRCEGGQTGPWKVLVVPVTFDTSLLERVTFIGEPMTGATLSAAVGNAGAKLGAMSFGRRSLDATITDTVTVSLTDEQFFDPDHPNADGTYPCDVAAMSRTAIAQVQLNMDVSSFENFVFVFPFSLIDGNPSCATPALGGGGISTGPHFDVPGIFPFPGTVVWMSVINAFALPHVFLHESGHSMGLPHANLLDCGSVSLASDPATCTSSEYGDIGDIMGAPFLETEHSFNARYREYLGWMTVAEITANGVYELSPAESLPSALKLHRGDPERRDFLYLEYRRAIPVEWSCGLSVIRYLHDPVDPLVAKTHLLDMSPTIPLSLYEGYALTSGSFTDPATGVTLTMLSCDATKLRFSVSGL